MRKKEIQQEGKKELRKKSGKQDRTILKLAKCAEVNAVVVVWSTEVMLQFQLSNQDYDQSHMQLVTAGR